MALIQCPECKQNVSDKALKCPKCGYPISDYVNGSIVEDKNTENVTEKAEDETKTVEDKKVTCESHEEVKNVQQISQKQKMKKKMPVLIIGITAVVLGIVLLMKMFSTSVSVKEVSISKWRLTESTSYGEYYEGTVMADQKKSFVAVIGEYEDEECFPEFVYVEDGVGVMETYESSDEDPSIKYRPIGYLSGNEVEETDMQISFADSDYNDWTYSDSTSCTVQIDIIMNYKKNGILIFDVINESFNKTEKNVVVPVVDGKAEYSYFAELPFKSRGIDLSIIPTMFCEAATVNEKDCVVKEPFSAEKKETSYSNSYSGTTTLAFEGYEDGIIVYTRELKEGGNPEKRGEVMPMMELLHDEKCTFETYDSVADDETIFMPEYEFEVIGVIQWTKLDKETI